MQNQPPADEVVLFMDHPNPEPKPNQSPEPINQNTTQTQDKNPTTATRTLRRLQFSKPKSRFVEFNHPLPLKPIPISEFQDPGSTRKARDQLHSSDDEDEDNELLKEEENNAPEEYRKKKRKVRWRAIAESLTFVGLMACLVTSRTVHRWKDQELWGLATWKWYSNLFIFYNKQKMDLKIYLLNRYLMALVVLCGRLVSGWLVGLIAFLIERSFMLREKVLYFVYGLRNSVRNCVWLGLVLLAWYVMFDPEVADSTREHRVLWRVWRALIAFTIGAVVWLVKIILVKVLASSFHVATFFDRMKESVFHYIVLEKLSGSPLDDGLARSGRVRPTPARVTTRVGSRRIDMEKLRKLSREKPSAFSVKRLVNHVRSSGLSTISRTVDRTVQEFRETEDEITSEWEARSCSKRIFNHVAKDGAK